MCTVGARVQLHSLSKKSFSFDTLTVSAQK